MITRNYKSPILTVEYEQELKDLWQLLAQAKEVVAQRGSIKVRTVRKKALLTPVLYFLMVLIVVLTIKMQFTI